MIDTPVFSLDPDNTLPILDDWVSLTEAAQLLGFSRQHAYKLAQDRAFHTLRRVGTAHIAVVSREEVKNMAEKRRKTT